MKNNNNCNLKSCYLCRNCLPEWLPAIEAHRKVIRLKKGETLFKEDEPVTEMYFVYDGLVKVHKKWGADKELILRFAQKGEIVGHRGLGAGGIYPISATALEPVTICAVSLDFFSASLTVNNTLIQDLFNFFAIELKQSEQKMRDLVHMPVKGRIAYTLLSLADKFGLTETGSLSIKLSRQDFSSYVGATYETTFRMLNELVEEGLIFVDKKDIRIIDKNRLSSYISY